MADLITPKTDWSSEYDSNGTYVGDYFSYVDFNRIRNNLIVLTDLASQLYVLNLRSVLPNSKTVSDYPYADEINQFETRLDEINAQSIRQNIGDKITYFENGTFPDATELNRIESATLLLYTMMIEQAGGRRMLRFRLGLPSGSIKF